jgi:hypothetical protein
VSNGRVENTLAAKYVPTTPTIPRATRPFRVNKDLNLATPDVDDEKGADDVVLDVDEAEAVLVEAAPCEAVPDDEAVSHEAADDKTES